ncbi:MAG: hypothetical protein MK132_20075 [Lentisphaerales bacterium]|nr:hypothetical protein [Lentisphaerales bacterium]
MKNMIIGIKLLGLYFTILGVKSFMQYYFMFVRIKREAFEVASENFYPFMLEYGFTLLIGIVLIFLAPKVASIIYKEKLHLQVKNSSKSSCE